jgi:small subunit ribosomal protein S17
MSKNVMQGVVTGDKTAKTRRVEIPRLVRDSKYGKILRRRTVCYVHDENNESGLGDTVEIVECRPRSKMKRWELVRIISKGQFLDLAALRAAQKAHRREETEEDEIAVESPGSSEDA